MNGQMINIFTRFKLDKPAPKKESGYNIPVAFFYQDPIKRDYYQLIMKYSR